MRYSLLLYYPEPPPGAVDPEVIEAGERAFQTYAEDLSEAGILVSAHMFGPSYETTTVTVSDGHAFIGEGPEIDEDDDLLGGVFIIDTPNLDSALAWASKAPSAEWGFVEVRPVATRFVDGSWRAEQ